MGDLHVILTLLNDRVNDFFGGSSTDRQSDQSFSPADADVSTTFKVERFIVDQIDSSYVLKHFNGKENREVNLHEGVIQTERQVRMNTAPMILDPFNNEVTFYVG